MPMIDIADWIVVVVDDESDNIGVVELVFQFNNATVHTARSGKECLNLLQTVVPSLLLIDIQMPEMSGYELLALIRQNPDWKNIPAVAVTAYTQSEDLGKILRAGFDGYVAKPVNVMTLVDELIHILSQRAG